MGDKWYKVSYTALYRNKYCVEGLDPYYDRAKDEHRIELFFGNIYDHYDASGKVLEWCCSDVTDFTWEEIPLWNPDKTGKGEFFEVENFDNLDDELYVWLKCDDNTDDMSQVRQALMKFVPV